MNTLVQTPAHTPNMCMYTPIHTQEHAYEHVQSKHQPAQAGSSYAGTCCSSGQEHRPDSHECVRVTHHTPQRHKCGRRCTQCVRVAHYTPVFFLLSVLPRNLSHASCEGPTQSEGEKENINFPKGLRETDRGDLLRSVPPAGT